MWALFDRVLRVGDEFGVLSDKQVRSEAGGWGHIPWHAKDFAAELYASLALISEPE